MVKTRYVPRLSGLLDPGVSEDPELPPEVGIEPAVHEGVGDGRAHGRDVTEGEHQVEGRGGLEEEGVEFEDNGEGGHREPGESEHDGDAAEDHHGSSVPPPLPLRCNRTRRGQ